MSVYKKPASIIPENEEERLDKLLAYEILDTPAENTFEKIAMLAAQIFNTPIAQVSFVDKDRVFFKSNISPLDATEVDRADSFCALAILEDDVTIFEDLQQIPDLSDNRFVSMENGVRFYAGAPLKTREGYKLGTVCVLDVEPKEVTEQQKKMLESLSAIVVDELELRLAARKAVRIQTDMVNRIVHDLKNPNTTIKLSAELIKMKVADPTMVDSLASRIISASNNVLNNLNNMLDLSQVEDGNFSLNIKQLDVNAVLRIVKKNFELLAASKNQTVKLISSKHLTVSADPNRLQEIFENLLSNALKYSNSGTEVIIQVEEQAEMAIIKVTDTGQGLNAADMEKLFTRFARLSSVPTGKEHSNGLGLFLVKTMIELHNGKVWAESPGKGLGTTFYISMPIAVSF